MKTKYSNLTNEKLSEIIKNIINENGEDYQKLRAKCNWEQMIPINVLKHYGHPKDW